MVSCTPHNCQRRLSSICQSGLRSLSDAMPGCPAAAHQGPCSQYEGPTEAPSVSIELCTKRVFKSCCMAWTQTWAPWQRFL